MTETKVQIKQAEVAHEPVWTAVRRCVPLTRLAESVEMTNSLWSSTLHRPPGSHRRTAVAQLSTHVWSQLQSLLDIIHHQPQLTAVFTHTQHSGIDQCQYSDTVGWWQEGHLACKNVWLMVCWWWRFDCTSYSSSCHHHLLSSLAPIKSRTETFWCRLTQGVLENGC